MRRTAEFISLFALCTNFVEVAMSDTYLQRLIFQTSIFPLLKSATQLNPSTSQNSFTQLRF